MLLLTILAMPAYPVFAEGNSQEKPLEIGVVPYLSARVLIGSYEPLRLYLELTLGRPVKIYSATGFKQFYLNAKEGDYDVVISAAHIARILQKNSKFTPLARYSTNNHSLVMTALNSKLHTLQDLRGQVLAVPDQLSLATIVCMNYLRENGLRSGTDFHLLEAPSFSSAILLVQKTEARAAVTTDAVLSQMPQEMRESVRPIVDAGEFSNLIFLAHPRLGKNLTDLLSKMLLKFGNDTKDGKQFFNSTGFGGIVPVITQDMQRLDRYLAETNRLLNETP
ncbi:MAG: hypothetical protein B7Y56_01595 [Gallionellales bacterium 35-53-114]|nr:MAG: hypothetical protein B7Y56_01595 [Gallionellales bacterium 35-53-114]OYZ64324.1 MAG: hypothetical protein B7Y04_05375 [Gallionellales bacterium 24-53-125]OZB10368.1 MAG: hypothetical protein B7X61_02330 [Gallionellales bacterium 39-52-133]